MKKLIALLTLVLFAFIGCEKQPMNKMEPKEKPEQTHQQKTGLDTAIKGEYLISDVTPTETVIIEYHVKSNEPIKKLEYIAPVKRGSKDMGDGDPTYFDTFTVCGQKEFKFQFETRYTANFALIGTVSKNASLEKVSISINNESVVFNDPKINIYKNLFKDFRVKMPKETLHMKYEGHGNNENPETDKTGNQKQHK